MTSRSPRLTTRDYIDVRHGKFDCTTRAQFDDAFDAFEKSRTNHLAVFFHGGLVDRSSGMAEAEKLVDGYRKAGAYPFFFIWNSDLLTAVQGWLYPFAENRVIRRVVEQHILFFSRQLSDVLKLKDSRGDLLRAIGNLSRDDPPPRLTTLGAVGRIVDSIWSRRKPDVILPPVSQTSQRIDAFEKDLERDVSDLGGMLDETTRFTATIGSNILRRLWERFRSGHDHGLYTTLIEEVAIAIRLDKVLTDLWGTMKNDIDQAFQSDGTVFGGTAFLERLKRTCTTDMRLTLIGHSGGTAYIDRLLYAMDRELPGEVRADIVFIAAALSFERFAATMDSGVFGRRVRHYRLFALKDEIEGDYWQVPGVYDKSLLYLLSALCESDSDSDKALIGMQRYWSGARPYDVQDILTVTGKIKPVARVWSTTDATAAPGYRAAACKHQGFAVEPVTHESVQEFLR